MNEQDIKKILPEWTLSYILGEKRGETLYQAEKTSGDTTRYSAIRAISIPADKEEAEELHEKFHDTESYKKHIDYLVKRRKAELQLLRSLSSKPGIVSIKESYDISNSDETSYLLVARYDYIETFDSYVRSNGLTVGAAIRMGIDVCKGLENVRKLELVHGAVRPENIYVNDHGRFKLGGFDIDLIEKKRQISQDEISALRYASPEMCTGKEYTFSADVYSLGMVLYGVLNGGKLPFENECSQEKALERRLSGENIPKPAYNAGKLNEVVMKACSFEAKKRYPSPYYMRKALEDAFAELQNAMLDENTDIIAENSSPMMTFSDNEKPEIKPTEFDEKAFDEMAEKKRKAQSTQRKTTALGIGAMLVILLFCVGVYFGAGRSIESYGIHLEEGYDYAYTGELKTPTVTLNTLEEGKHFYVSYSNNKNIGTATVTVKGLGRFRGTKTKKFTINPEKCENFTAEEVTDTTVKLTWSKGKHAHRYWVYMYNEKTDDWDRIKVVDGSKKHYTVKDLEPDTEYRFRIKAVYDVKDEVYDSKSVETQAKTAKVGG